MLTPETILNAIGEVPNEPWEWGHYPTADGQMLTVAVPLPEKHGPVSMLILEFKIDKPLVLDPDTPLDLIIDDDRCRGICVAQTAFLLAATASPEELRGGIEYAVFGLAPRDNTQRIGLDITVTHVPLGSMSAQDLEEALGDSDTPEGLKSLLRKLQQRSQGSRGFGSIFGRRKTND